LRGGERLPAVRTLARDFHVNERVVLAALHELAADGILEMRPRSGAYVVPPHPASGEALPNIGAWLVTMLLQARARGLAPGDVSEYVRRSMQSRSVRAACIECNADQLHLLCTELSQDHGFVAEAAPLDDLNAEAPSLAVRRADVLVTTAFHADKVRRVASALRKPWIAVALRTEVMRDVGKHLRAGPVYYIATDVRFERKARRMLSRVGPVSNLRVAIIGRDDLDAIPDDAPTFVMTSARAHLRARYGERGGPGRPIHPPRQLSDDAARELLTFLLRMNMTTLAADDAERIGQASKTAGGVSYR
jgi:DNA-binding transcriptional regulator YhcF (GntR family)